MRVDVDAGRRRRAPPRQVSRSRQPRRRPISSRTFEVCVPREAFPPLEDGEFYVCDVIGARVVGPGGELGQVADMVSYPTADAFVVKTVWPEVGNAELPLLDDFIDEVDAEHHEVRVKGAAVDLLRQRPS